MLRDQIFLNGKVLTMEPQSPQVSAFGVVGDRFGAVGSDTDVRRFHSIRHPAKILFLFITSPGIWLTSIPEPSKSPQ